MLELKSDRLRAGFTLIELMVVVALIAIMMAIAVPSFVSFISNYRATTAINDFYQGVTVTRTEALKRGHRVLMIPNASDGTPSIGGNWVYGWTVFVDNNNDQLYQASTDDLVFRHASLPASITTAGAAGGVAFSDGTNRAYVLFDGTGYPRLLSGATLSGGIVIIDSTGSTPSVRTLCLGNIGRPRIVVGPDPSACAAG